MIKLRLFRTIRPVGDAIEYRILNWESLSWQDLRELRAECNSWLETIETLAEEKEQNCE